MDKESSNEVKNDIQYVNMNPPVFQMPYYEIKSGKICVRTGK